MKLLAPIQFVNDETGEELARATLRALPAHRASDVLFTATATLETTKQLFKASQAVADLPEEEQTDEAVQKAYKILGDINKTVNGAYGLLISHFLVEPVIEIDRSLPEIQRGLAVYDQLWDMGWTSEMIERLYASCVQACHAMQARQSVAGFPSIGKVREVLDFGVTPVSE